jgi:cell division protein FtsB
VVFIVSAVFAVYFLASFGISALRSQQLGNQEDILRSDIAGLEARYERLKALEQYLNSDEYIETTAREQLGLVKEGEIAFVAISSQPTPAPAPGEPRPDLWWEVLIR